jgi:hypothetical protein
VRTLSLNFRAAVFAQESGEVPIFLLTITHPSLSAPILLSSDATARITTDPLLYGTISRGNTFLYVGMQISLPDDEDQSPPAAKMIISNVDRSIIPLIRSILLPPSVTIECVLASALDTVELSVPAMDMVDVTYDAAQLTFDLAIDAMALEPYPAGNFDPASFPGLFI